MNNEVKTINGYNVKDVKAVRTYDTVALLKADRKLKQGQHVKTRGYYSINDGGSAEYYITSTQSESDYQENLENGLYANLITNGSINIKQLGANDTDISGIMIEAITKYNNIYINGDYTINDTILVSNVSNKELIFNGTIYSESATINEKPVFEFRNSSNITIENLVLSSTRNQYESAPTGHTKENYDGSNRVGFRLKHVSNFYLNNANLSNLQFDIFASQNDNDEICNNININNLTSKNCSMPIYATYTDGLNISNCDILLATELGKGNHIIYTSSNVKNIRINDCKLNAQDKYIDFALHFYDSIRTSESAPNVIINNTLVKAPELMIITSYGSCEINDSHFTMIPFDNVSSQRVISFDSYNVINVNNCIFKNTQAQFIYSRDVYTNNKININNSKIYYSLLSGANSYAMIQLTNSEGDSNNEFTFNDCYIECARFIYSPANQNKNLIVCNNCKIKSNAYDYFISIRNADNNIIFKDNYIEFTDTLTRLIYNGGSTLINLKLLSSYLYNVNGIALDNEKTNIIALNSYINNTIITI